jgi:hypothetical protein
MANASGVCLMIAAAVLAVSASTAAMDESSMVAGVRAAVGGSEPSQRICKESPMSVIPEGRTESIEFCEVHAPVWAANAAGLGLSPAVCAAFTAATDEARMKYDDALKARDAAKAATASSNDSIREMKSDAATLVRTIKAFAEASANPQAVYNLAQIPAPLPPAPLPLPGKPTNLSVTLLPTGAVQLSWDAENAAASSGAFYNIARKLPGAANFVGIGGAPGSTTQSRRMTFTDASVPTSAAAAGVQYIIQGQRGTSQGLPSDAVVVQFGTDTPGGFSVQGAEGIKLAA